MKPITDNFLTGDEPVPMSEKALAYSYQWVDGSGFESVQRDCLLLLRLVRLSDGRHYHNVLIFGGYVPFANLSLECYETPLRASGKSLFTLKNFIGEEVASIQQVAYDEAMTEIFDQVGVYFDVLGENVQLMVKDKLDKALGEKLDELAWQNHEMTQISGGFYDY